MKVILLQNIYKHGVAGEVVEVADGFARNYLIPRKMATKATEQAIQEHNDLMDKVEARRAAYEEQVNEVARHIDGVELMFERRAAVSGKLFGSVTTQEIVDALLEETGIDINRRRISQQGLREVGTHEVSVRLGTEMSPTLIIHVIPEGGMEEWLKAREAAEQEGDLSDEEIYAEAIEAAQDAADMETEVIPTELAQEVVSAADAAQTQAEDDESANA